MNKSENSIKYSRLIIYAPYIHTGGGAILLNELVCALPKGLPVVALFDRRMQFENKVELQEIYRYNPKITQ